MRNPDPNLRSDARSGAFQRLQQAGVPTDSWILDGLQTAPGTPVSRAGNPNIRFPADQGTLGEALTGIGEFVWHATVDPATNVASYLTHTVTGSMTGLAGAAAGGPLTPQGQALGQAGHNEITKRPSELQIGVDLASYAPIPGFQAIRAGIAAAGRSAINTASNVFESGARSTAENAAEAATRTASAHHTTEAASAPNRAAGDTTQTADPATGTSAPAKPDETPTPANSHTPPLTRTGGNDAPVSQGPTGVPDKSSPDRIKSGDRPASADFTPGAATGNDLDAALVRFNREIADAAEDSAAKADIGYVPRNEARELVGASTGTAHTAVDSQHTISRSGGGSGASESRGAGSSGGGSLPPRDGGGTGSGSSLPDDPRAVMDHQVWRANNEPGYFDQYYKSNGYRKDVSVKDDSGANPPQLTRDRATRA
ncbi:hypothetical protein, partial [Nocardia sp. NPDC058497]|uniref:hypothetical protein n=1 Tax=Nocardia sp. NPDC058497 TaxID=3346529 RepID=UPI00365E6730